MIPAEFLDAVKAGKIEGLSWSLYRGEEFLKTPSTEIFLGFHGKEMLPLEQHEIDHLCAHLRRWMVSFGWDVSPGYSPDGEDLHLYRGRVDSDESMLNEGAEIDRHIAAALWVLEQEGE